MPETVRAEVAAFAHGLDVVRVFAEWMAGAQVGNGEENVALGEDGFVSMSFRATFIEVRGGV